MHQPLHASDNNDAGGNSVKVMVDGFEHKARDELRGFWDVLFVEALGRPPAALAQKLLEQITPEREAEWKQGTYDDWAMEAFDIAFTDVYGETPLSKDTLQHLDAASVERAEKDVALQLSRAGIRLAGAQQSARAAGGRQAKIVRRFKVGLDAGCHGPMGHQSSRLWRPRYSKGGKFTLPLCVNVGTPALRLA
jgi:hypothetical protein